ncbi:MAG: hypothetical protein RJA72_864 [Pseudomonadota bacterium]
MVGELPADCIAFFSQTPKKKPAIWQAEYPTRRGVGRQPGGRAVMSI